MAEQNGDYECSFIPTENTVPDYGRTFPKLLTWCATNFPQRRFLGTRQYYAKSRGAYEWYSYLDIYHMTTLLAQALPGLGLSRGDRIGIISPNRTEWTVVDMACSVQGIVLVPIYDTQSRDEIAYVCQDAGLKLIFSSADRLTAIVHVLDRIQQIIVFDERLDDRAALLKQRNKLHFELPKAVILQPRQCQIFDEFDKAEGMYDPSIPQKEEGETSKGVAINSERTGTAHYNYEINQSEIDALCKSQFRQLPPVEIATTSFWKLIMDEYLREEGVLDKQNKFYGCSDFIIRYDADATKENDLISLVYTSGTTGKPKGV